MSRWLIDEKKNGYHFADLEFFIPAELSIITGVVMYQYDLTPDPLQPLLPADHGLL